MLDRLKTAYNNYFENQSFSPERRQFLKNSLSKSLSLSYAYAKRNQLLATMLEQGKGRSHEISISELKDDRNYLPQEWGRSEDSEDIDWEMISHMTIEDVIQYIKNPAEASQFFKLIDQNVRAIKTVQNELQNINEANEVNDHVRNTARATSSIFGMTFTEWFPEIQKAAERLALIKDYIPTDDEISYITGELRSAGLDVQGGVTGYDIVSYLYLVYARVILYSWNMPEDEKLEYWAKLPQERDFVPYAPKLPEEYDSYERESERNDLGRIFEIFQNISDIMTPECDDASYATMQMLVDNGYPALAIHMDSRDGPIGHVVHLFKCKEGYGYIGFNPYSSSGPSYETIEDLLQTFDETHKNFKIIDHTESFR